MKQFSKIFALASVVAITASVTACTQTNINDKGTKWHWEGNTIVVETPQRPEGQKSVIGLTAPKLEVVRTGFVGLGMRGPGAVERFTHIPGTQVCKQCLQTFVASRPSAIFCSPQCKNKYNVYKTRGKNKDKDGDGNA